jgi:hypothetical protein
MPMTTSNAFGSAAEIKGTSAPLLFEILDKVAKAEDEKSKIELLRKNDSNSLRSILKGAFDRSIVWELPEGTPPYQENDAPAGTEHTTLYTEAKRLHYFIKGANVLPKSKREMMFIQMLEGLHAEEAKLLINVKEKKLSSVYDGLTDTVVKKAFGWNDKYIKS